METNEKQSRSCPGDCRKCNFYQHAYCASQMCQNSFPMLETIKQTVDELKAEIAELKAEKELTLPRMHKNDGGADNRSSLNPINED